MWDYRPADKPPADLLPASAGGYPVRKTLTPDEAKFFHSAPSVAGMSAEDGAVLLNPWSPLPAPNKRAVAHLEASRSYMGRNAVPPPLNEQQRKYLAGIGYDQWGELPQRQTIISRNIAGDPSGGPYTPEQERYADQIHAYMLLEALVPEACAAAYQRIAGFVRGSALHAAPPVV